jgi:hypothetical protein
MPEEIRRDPELPGRIGGRWRDPVMSPVEVVGARLDGEVRCVDHAVEGATEPMHRLVGAGRLVWLSSDQVDPGAALRCSVCDRGLSPGSPG